jgi:peroxin-1
MKPLNGKARLAILQMSLKFYGAPLSLSPSSSSTSSSSSSSSSSPFALSPQPSVASVSTHYVPSVGHDVADVILALEGYQPGDIWGLSKRLSVHAARRTTHSTTGSATAHARTSMNTVDGRTSGHGIGKLYTTYDDIIEVAKEHSPSNSSSSSSSSMAPTTWKDIGGLHSAKQAIIDVIQLPIIFRKLFQLSPIRMPRAVLLYGPPGCGKTVLAQAAANECGLAFISVRGLLD